MAKSSNPDRHQRRDRRQREPSEFAEATLSVDRVTRVVKGGRRMRFRAIVVVGNKKGKVGLGTGKANEVQAAVGKATKDARRNMIRVPLVKGTIPHEVEVKFKAAKLRLIPASEGTGVIAGGALRIVLEHAGVKNVLSKRYGTGNKLVNAQASIIALQRLHSVDRQGRTVETPEPAPAKPTAEQGEMPAVRVVSSKDVTQEGTLKG
ncbi:MAG: 30S ribosomal subunit protein S5 [Candidatus Peregrinibacteria bacterium Gr01-1014_25]|nr:MAG: 30S ribosomal subunit protein S5 [Candidatus Peregrinibacteria bacterium Gr01-1014_25]